MSFQQTKFILNQLIADLSQLGAAVHQVHWYMRGEGFLFLHPLMDEWLDDVNDQLDEIAERLITLGGSPYSTLEEFASHSNIKSTPATWGTSTQQHLSNLSASYKYIAKTYGEAIEIANQEGDTGTEDILTGFKRDVEKRIWMIQAELNKSPEIN